MELIDFDGLFDEKLTQYMSENKEKYTEQQWENVIPKLYKKFGDTYVAKIKCTPKEYYAKIASKFVAVHGEYGKKLKGTTESLYRSLEKQEGLDLVENADDLACAIFLLSGIKDLGKDVDAISKAFDADGAKVRLLMTYAVSDRYGVDKQTTKINHLEKENGID